MENNKRSRDDLRIFLENKKQKVINLEEGEVKPFSDEKKTLARSSCKQFYFEGRCKYGEKCIFIHNQNTMPNYCNEFHRNGGCDYGIRCVFLHDELETKAKTCQYSKDDKCSVGDKCRFPHSTSISSRTEQFLESNKIVIDKTSEAKSKEDFTEIEKLITINQQHFDNLTNNKMDVEQHVYSLSSQQQPLQQYQNPLLKFIPQIQNIYQLQHLLQQQPLPQQPQPQQPQSQQPQSQQLLPQPQPQQPLSPPQQPQQKNKESGIFDFLNIERQIFDIVSTDSSRLFNFIQWRGKLPTIDDFRQNYPSSDVDDIIRAYYNELTKLYNIYILGMLTNKW